ncbi:xanthine dehydrogenase family protein molybdopterin-binding subunit [Sinorhizobium meliloti]|uniref:xanthine dehydrogenase family protein molybdopterin-binding subunit n=1 Tax=Rhizobium meliloti TaxID=382 RepID=UPI000B49C7EC|nr:xanthine dehydrogenase family protein molybdopterin-binding subunit [Sinorhizobium meliloti]ASP94950.1 acylaldehyde oxidase [Sinorhizobium meliloti]MQX56571.1 molybdopterin-dependent oxidoreductase [Sinorhizobium meliloti]
MTTAIGKSLSRIDGRLKVTGQATYAAEFNQEGQAHAVIVGSTVGLGRIESIDSAAVEKMPGVVAVISHLNAQRLAYNEHRGPIDPPAGERLHVLQGSEVRFFGEPVAIVVAETLDQAEHAANALKVTYSARQPQVDAHAGERVIPAVARRPGARAEADVARGDADKALETAAVKVEAEYVIARENHNPMEPHATIAAWNGDRLTLWSKSQFVVNEQAEIAAIFGLPPENVQVICPFIGGAFGTSLRTWPHVTLAALAARHVNRPVKLVLTRKQMFFATGHRPYTLQRIALGAQPDGKLIGIVHEGAGETSRYEEFMEALTSVTSFMYSCPNVRTSYRLIPLDASTPTYMRGPGEASGIHALECAVDELAYKLQMDPIDLRRINEPQIDEGRQVPFSSRSMLKCYDLGAERFGWSRRTPEPGSMRDGRLLIGYGMANASYPCLFAPASARVRLLPDGTVEIEAAASDMGPGTYTSMSQVAAEYLGIPVERIRFSLGRSDFPATPPHGGSMTMASVGSAIRAACLDLQAKAAVLAAKGGGNAGLAGQSPEALEWRDGMLFVKGRSDRGVTYADLVSYGGESPLVGEGTAARDAETGQKYSMHSFGAVFAEVAIDPDVKTIKVRRALGAYGVGRVVNPKLATSQCIGGMIGGIGMAIMERTLLDRRNGRPINAHMADYLVPVNLDTPHIEAHFIDEEDTIVNPLGVKGLGEIALVGMSAAVSNAIHHATGRRVHELPIMIESLL